MISTLNRGSAQNKSGLSPAEKADIINGHRQYHKDLLNYLEVDEKDFNVKMVFTHDGRKVVGLFPGEMNKPKGFFMEFIDSMLQPTDIERKVYWFEPILNYDAVYTMLPKGTYAVPIEDLQEVSIPKKETMDFKVDLPNDNIHKDDHFSNMTIKDLAAILWQRPVSGKAWLNELITNVNQEEGNI